MVATMNEPRGNLGESDVPEDRTECRVFVEAFSNAPRRDDGDRVGALEAAWYAVRLYRPGR